MVRRMTNFKQAWCAWILAAAVAVTVDHTSAEDKQILYASGQFPTGHVYGESELEGLVDKALPNPSYLIGRFVFLGVRNNQHVFSTFSQGALNPDDIAFGKTLISVKFFGNVPPRLEIGTAINATDKDPLTVKSVRRSGDGFILVVAESWSTLQ